MRLSATLYFLAACALGVLLAWQQDRYSEAMANLSRRADAVQLQATGTELLRQRDALRIEELRAVAFASKKGK